MANIIGVRFKNVGKIYYFDPDGEKLRIGDWVIVETSSGVEAGRVAVPNRYVDDQSLKSPLKKVIRKADEYDIKTIESNLEKERRALEICEKKIIAHNLEMKLISADYSFDNNKIIFYFSADGRVDFRELVKDLASVFKTRIELRQIGARDETKLLGGLGICGRPYCCNTFLGEFHPVSIKMAKEQGLSLNPAKISGTCGRLMCCLKYEQEAYIDLATNSPKVDEIVNTPEGRGKVVDINLIAGKVSVKLDESPEGIFRSFSVSEIKENQQKLENKLENTIKNNSDKTKETTKNPKSPKPPKTDKTTKNDKPSKNFKNEKTEKNKKHEKKKT